MIITNQMNHALKGFPWRTLTVLIAQVTLIASLAFSALAADHPSGVSAAMTRAQAEEAHILGTELSIQAQEECDQGRRASARDARLTHFHLGEALAEQAVKLDDQLADAHFALFCNLGEQMRIDGEKLSSLFAFRRVMGELDRTLELDPNHPDALSSKGTLLTQLPWALGGNSRKGERLLRQMIRRAPDAVNARLSLAKVCAQRGDRAEAITLATEALHIAQAEDRLDLIPEAQATLTMLRLGTPP